MENVSVPGGNVSDVSGPTNIERVLVPVLYTLILVTGTLGHILVIVIISRTMKRGRRGPASGTGAGTILQANANGTDVLLLCLSVADLLLLSCIPYHTIAIASSHWPFGDFMCKAVSFVGAMCTSASAFTLAALAFVRYVIVVHPTKAYHWCRSGRVRLVAGALWIPAMVLALPQFAFRALQPGVKMRSPQEDLVCFNFLSDVDHLVQSVCHFVFAFALPLVVITAAYGKIFHFLRRTRQNRTAHADRLERYQTQVTHTSVLLVLAFVLCWLPSYAMMLVQLRHGSSATAPSSRLGPFATFARVAATSSTVANPVLYVFMSQKFRKELKELVSKRRCRS